MWEYEFSEETNISRKALWRHWADIKSWPTWNNRVESIEIHGPFAVGTTFTMTPPGDDPVTMQITEIVPENSFTNEMNTGDFVVTAIHKLESAASGRTRIIYRIEISGPNADQIGTYLGPVITADLPDAVAALIKTAE